jgi:hypothetical protein
MDRHILVSIIEENDFLIPLSEYCIQALNPLATFLTVGAILARIRIVIVMTLGYFYQIPYYYSPNITSLIQLF